MSSFPKSTRNEQNFVKPRVRKILTDHQWFWWITPANMYGRTGVSDYCAVKAGMFMAVETKFGPRDPTPMQVGYLDSIRACNHFAFVVRETTLNAFETFLDMLDKSIALYPAVAPAEIGGPMVDAIKRMSDTEILDPLAYERKLKAKLAKETPHV